MQPKKKLILLALIVGALLWVGKDGRVETPFGAAGVTLYSGGSTQGETLIATTGTNAVPRTAERRYLRICKTSNAANDTRQITLAVNASPSHGQGILLDSRMPCWETNDLNLVNGEINAVSSPSAASVSYSQW